MSRNTLLKLLEWEVKLLYYSYDDQLLVEYIVRCAEGQLAYFNITDLDMEGRVCEDNGHKKYEHVCMYIIMNRYV